MDVVSLAALGAVQKLNKELKSDIYSTVSDEVLSTWELGGITSSGVNNTDTKVYRSNYIYVYGLGAVRLGDKTKMYRINLYDKDKRMIKQAPFDLSVYNIDSGVYYIRIVVNSIVKTSYQVFSDNMVKTGVALSYASTTASYGFLPQNPPAVNTLALQQAIDAGGVVRIDVPGVYDVQGTITIGDNTTLEFGAGVSLRRTSNDGYVFINKGAFTRTSNENITIRGLELVCNGYESTAGTLITGLRGQLAFFYVDNLNITDFKCFDLGKYSYGIQVCTFYNIVIDRIRVEGLKDAIHLGKGRVFRIRDGIFKTYDDPIALNGHDYDTGNPQLGWIENGIIENCYDLADTSTTGFFIRMLSGAWKDWASGMKLQKSDTVVCDGKLYRVVADPDGAEYTTLTKPQHSSGVVTYDGNIKWAMVQDDDVTYTAGCRNIRIKDIYLQKARPVALSLHFDKDKYSRSYYPQAPVPVQTDLILDGIHQDAPVATLISAVTPISSVKIVNSNLLNPSIKLNNVATDGIVYPKANILMLGNSYKGSANAALVSCTDGRTADVKVSGSVVDDNTYSPAFSAGVNVVVKDI